jgi:hypothetical protein
MSRPSGAAAAMVARNVPAIRSGDAARDALLFAGATARDDPRTKRTIRGDCESVGAKKASNA